MVGARERTNILRIVVAVGTTLLAVSAPAAPSSATPHLKGAVPEPAVLRRQVVLLFDRLDHVGRVVERVREDLASVGDRISELTRRIEARREILNRRAAEAYMAGRAGEIESLLGATSLRDVQDAFQYIEAVSQEDHDLLVSLRHERGILDLERARLVALGEELRRKRAWLEETASDLVDELRRQRQARRGAQPGAIADGTAPELPGAVEPASPPSTVRGREAITRLVRERFAPLGSRAVLVALCVVERESGFDPSAINPATGAAGLFQFLPSTWETVSELAGWAPASVFDAQANVAVAAWTVAHYGWHPWRSVAADCGV